MLNYNNKKLKLKTKEDINKDLEKLKIEYAKIDEEEKELKIKLREEMKEKTKEIKKKKKYIRDMIYNRENMILCPLCNIYIDNRFYEKHLKTKNHIIKTFNEKNNTCELCE
jgi:hypothetical protein